MSSSRRSSTTFPKATSTFPISFRRCSKSVSAWASIATTGCGSTSVDRTITCRPSRLGATRSFSRGQQARTDHLPPVTRPVHQVFPSSRATSIAPDGQLYPVPNDMDAEAAFAQIGAAAHRHRSRGGRVVAVQGLGFVGAAVAAAVATATDDFGRPLYFVVGVDLPQPDTYWKVARINAGLAPVGSPDPELLHAIHEAVFTNANLVATTAEDAYALAD